MGANLTWMYIASVNAFMILIIAVYIRYGDLKLGSPDSQPEYNDLTWFTMLFSCGIGTGDGIRYRTCRPRQQ